MIKKIILLLLIPAICLNFMVCSSNPVGNPEKAEQQKTAALPAEPEAVNNHVAWGKQIGAGADYSLLGVIIDKIDNVLVVGNTSGIIGKQNFGKTDVFFVNYNSFGDEFFRLQVGSDQDDTDDLCLIMYCVK